MKKGFTLVELLCILGLISLILMIASPSLGAYMKRDRLRLATERLINDLRYAKMYAMSRGEVSIVGFEKKQGELDFSSYRIFYKRNGIRTTLKRVILPESVVICRQGDDSSFDGSNEIGFDPLGIVLPRACTIALKDLKTGEKKTITLTIAFSRIMEVVR